MTESRAELPENDEKVLIELLEYLKKNDLKALFIVCPYWITEEHYAVYNTISDRISEYGFDFLNTNDHYSEMNIDFSTDFYNAAHVNNLGAEKYTEYLGKYLVDKYDLPDHRDDDNYAEWWELYERFAAENEKMIAKVLISFEWANEGIRFGEDIRNTENLFKWGTYVSDGRYTVIAYGDPGLLQNISYADEKILSSIGFAPENICDKVRYIGVFFDGGIWKENPQEEEILISNIGQKGNRKRLVVVHRNNEWSVTVNGTKVDCLDQAGFNMFVYDNQFSTIIDSVFLSVKDGRLVLSRDHEIL